MYLSARVPLPVNYNPFMMFAPDPDPRYNDQVFLNFFWRVSLPESHIMEPTASHIQC